MIYKAWIHIEEIDEDKDHYKDIGEPYEAGSFNTKTAARKFIENELLVIRELTFPPKTVPVVIRVPA